MLKILKLLLILYLGAGITFFVCPLEARGLLNCSNLFKNNPDIKSIVELQRRVTRAKGIAIEEASGRYVHQVLFATNTYKAVKNADWINWFFNNFLAEIDVKNALTSQWVPTNLNSFVWTMKNTKFSPEARRAIVVTFQFHEGYVFADQHGMNRLMNAHEIETFNRYAIVGVYDKANEYYKIKSFNGLRSIEIFDPTTRYRKIIDL